MDILRAQDIHKIVDIFTRMAEAPRYARMVPLAEITDPKNDFNLNLPRYIDSTEPEDLQDIDGHLRGGIPERDIDALDRYWQVIPGVRAELFKKADRSGYSQLKVAVADIKTTIFGHPEFTAYNESATKLFAKWKTANIPFLKGIVKGTKPKELIEQLSENLLSTFEKAQLLDSYDMYQHLMDYWDQIMQDDAYLIAIDGWVRGAQPREIFQMKDKNNKLTWPESHDYLKGKRRFKSDLIPAHILVAHYFVAEHEAIETLDNQLATLEQQLDEMREENGGEEGLLTEVIDGEGDKQKIAAKVVKARLKEIGKSPIYVEERAALEKCADLLDQQAEAKSRRKLAQEDLDRKIDAKYPKLTEAEIKILVVDDKWLVTIAAAVQGELDRVSQTLTGRIRQLAERYATPLPRLADELSMASARVDEHLKNMGAVWK